MGDGGILAEVDAAGAGVDNTNVGFGQGGGRVGGGLQDRETAWAILDTVLSRKGVLIGLVSAAMSGPEHQAVVLGIQSLLAVEPLLMFWQVALLWWPSLGCSQVVLLCP